MSGNEPRGPFCQSCGMPLGSSAHLGTDATGHLVSEYCHFCFVNGAFTAPEISMQGMIDRCVDVMEQQGIMPRAQAQALMTGMLPTLKRWRAAASPVLGIG
jgi:hypothetical protein